MSWFSDFFQGKEGTPQTTQWNQNPQYSNVPNNINSMWDYVGKGLQSIQAGQPPTWFQQFRPLEEKQRKNALTGTYYGSGAGTAGKNQFGPGILASQQAADVKAGRRGAGAGSNYAKQLAQYGQGMSDIDDYLSKLGADAMQQGEQRYLTAGSQLPQGPQGAWNVNPGSAYQPSGFESLMGGLGSIMGTGNNFSSLLGGIGGMFNQGGNTNTGNYASNPNSANGQAYNNVINNVGSYPTMSGGYNDYMQAQPTPWL